MVAVATKERRRMEGSSQNRKHQGEEMVNHPEWEAPVTKEQFNRARENHDIYTLLIMIPIVYYTIKDFDMRVFTEIGQREWTGGPYFWHLWGWNFFFAVSDTIWMYFVPHSVRTPKTLIEHHIMVIVYSMAPLPFPPFRPALGCLLSVEINSFFSIGRRFFWKKNMKILGDTFHWLFMVTWILTRNIIYPLLLVRGVANLYAWRNEPWESTHLALLWAPVHGYFCYINMIWTRDLWTPIAKEWYWRIQSWFSRSSGKKRQ